MKISRMLYPILIECVRKIQKGIIDTHNIPIKLFETGRDFECHKMLINKDRTKGMYITLNLETI